MIIDWGQIGLVCTGFVVGNGIVWNALNKKVGVDVYEKIIVRVLAMETGFLFLWILGGFAHKLLVSHGILGH
jgi:hypothetical protein